MTWDKTMVERAAADGWKLMTTIDNGTIHPYYMAVSTGSATEKAVIKHIVETARRGSALHQHALRTMALSRLKPK